MNPIKHLFTVPEGEKVTDRHLKRVLVSSVCGILFCMTCLMTTTWAWYTATVEVGISPITVSEHKAELFLDGKTVKETEPTVEVKKDSTVPIKVVFETDANPSQDVFSTEDKLGYVPGRYIVLAVFRVEPPAQEGGESKETYIGSYCLPASCENDKWAVELTLTSAEDCKVSFSTSWQPPLRAVVVKEVPEKLTLIEAAKTLPETTETTEPSGTETSAPTTQPVETTAPSTEATKPVETTAPSTETTTPATTQATEES